MAEVPVEFTFTGQQAIELIKGTVNGLVQEVDFVFCFPWIG